MLCDRIAIMDHAKLIALDTPAGLLRLADVVTSIEIHLDRHVDATTFRVLPEVVDATAEDHAIMLHTVKPEVTLPALFTLAKDQQLHLGNIQMHQATLEDVFLKLTGRSLRE